MKRDEVDALLAQGIITTDVLYNDMFSINPGITQAAVKDIIFSVIELMVDKMVSMEFFNIDFIGFFYKRYSRTNTYRKITFDFMAHKSLRYIFNLRRINQQHYKLPNKSILVEEFLRSSPSAE